MLSRKDYELLAKVLHKVKDVILDVSPTNPHRDAELLGVHLVASELVKVLQADNPRFNPVKFYEAAGILPFKGPDAQ